jgi:hypothetical protein
MKITEIITKGREEYDYDVCITIELLTDKYTGGVSFGEGEPEDMSLGRDLSGAYDISSLLKEAYEAGKRGEEFCFEEISGEEED